MKGRCTVVYFRDLSGKQFGRLTVVEHCGSSPDHQALWKCRCACGNYTTVRGHSLTKGTTQSCGCLKDEKSRDRLLKHGYSRTRLYRIWDAMRARCYNPSHKAYKNYGGRGVTVCDEWRDNFPAFKDWAFYAGYDDGLTIDRIDVNGNYEPNNCRWITNAEQQANRSDSIVIEYSGEKKIVSQWAREYGISANVLGNRLRSGWDFERALKTPVRKIRRKRG